jgi:hypothetical protein
LKENAFQLTQWQVFEKTKISQELAQLQGLQMALLNQVGSVSLLRQGYERCWRSGYESGCAFHRIGSECELAKSRAWLLNRGDGKTIFENADFTFDKNVKNSTDVTLFAYHCFVI